MADTRFYCPLTGRLAIVTPHDFYISYNLKIASREIKIFLCDDCIRKLKDLLPQHIIAGLIAHGKWPSRSFVITNEHVSSHLYTSPLRAEEIILPEYLDQHFFPKSPVDKFNNLLLNLFDRQNEDGESINVKHLSDDLWIKGYFKSPSECNNYLAELALANFIKLTRIPGSDNQRINITMAGNIRVFELREVGVNSSNCFIAMAFDDKTERFRKAIKNALSKTGFKSILIDEENLASDKTIPDGILAAIKQSKFCIADFTLHRNGVYFESGFALGLGKPVIYLCEKEEFENSHFDIKQLQHIIYESPDDLEKKLSAKIEAWIK